MRLEMKSVPLPRNTEVAQAYRATYARFLCLIINSLVYRGQLMTRGNSVPVTESLFSMR